MNELARAAAKGRIENESDCFTLWKGWPESDVAGYAAIVVFDKESDRDAFARLLKVSEGAALGGEVGTAPSGDSPEDEIERARRWA